MQKRQVNMQLIKKLIEPFIINTNQLEDLLYSTSAVLVGGAVTHYIYNSLNPTAGPTGSWSEFPVTSDLDFWVYSPRMEHGAGLHHKRAFDAMVILKFKTVLNLCGYIHQTTPIGMGHIGYDLVCDQFKTQAGINIKVHWFVNKATGRYMNLVFTDTPVDKMITKTDIPIGQALIYSCGGLMLQYYPVVVDDLKQRLLTKPDPMLSSKLTGARVNKYLQRYDMKIRDSS